MNLTQLRYFLSLAANGHFTKTAQELHLTQSALSASIGRMESELECKLFEKDGRNMRLSKEGKLFADHVSKILREYDAALHELKESQRDDQSALNIGTTSFQFHQKLLLDFLKNNPNIQIRQHLIMASDVAAQARRSDVDFIISCLPCYTDYTECRKIYSERLFLVLPRSHPLADRACVTLEDIKDLGFISLPSGFAYREFTDGMFAGAGYRQQVVLESYPDQFPTLVDSGIGAVLATESSINAGLYRSGVRILPLADPSCIRTLYLIWNKDRPMNQATKIFSGFIKGTDYAPI